MLNEEELAQLRRALEECQRLQLASQNEALPRTIDSRPTATKLTAAAREDKDVAACV
jgi:hypothetical protein